MNKDVVIDFSFLENNQKINLQLNNKSVMLYIYINRINYEDYIVKYYYYFDNKKYKGAFISSYDYETNIKAAMDLAINDYKISSF